MSTQASTPQLSSAYGLDNVSLQNAIKKSFSADTLQKKSETLIDNNYAWLEGSRSQPDTTVDFSDAQQVLASAVADESQTQFNNKPVCSSEQLWQYAAQLESTPLTAPCRPEQTDFAVFRQKIEETIVQAPSSAEVGPSALEQGAGISMGDSIENPQKIQVTQQQTSIARGIFGVSRYAFWIILFVLSILILLVGLMHKTFASTARVLTVPFFYSGEYYDSVQWCRIMAARTTNSISWRYQSSHSINVTIFWVIFFKNTTVFWDRLYPCISYIIYHLASSQTNAS
jgi:hypothetical protein